MQRRGALLPRTVRSCGPLAVGAARARRGRDRRRSRRAGCVAVRPRAQRVLVRLAADHRRSTGTRSLPERHGPTGDLGGARRNGVGTGESRGRHRRDRRHGPSALPGDPAPVPRHRRWRPRYARARRPFASCRRTTATCERVLRMSNRAGRTWNTNTRRCSPGSRTSPTNLRPYAADGNTTRPSNWTIPRRRVNTRRTTPPNWRRGCGAPKTPMRACRPPCSRRASGSAPSRRKSLTSPALPTGIRRRSSRRWPRRRVPHPCPCA